MIMLHCLDWYHRCDGVPASGAGWAKKKTSIDSSSNVGGWGVGWGTWGCLWPVLFVFFSPLI